VATLDYDDSELIASSVAAGLAADREARAPRVNDPDLFRRVCRRARRHCNFGFSAHRDPASALKVELPLCYSLTLDRAVTAPNAVIGISLGKPASSRSGWTFLFPGETLQIPGGATKCWIWNADGLEQLSGGLPAADMRQLGYCGFLIGTRPGGISPAQLAPHPSARIFHVAEATIDSPMYFATGASRRLLVRAIPLDINGDVISNASFLADIRMRRSLIGVEVPEDDVDLRPRQNGTPSLIGVRPGRSRDPNPNASDRDASRPHAEHAIGGQDVGRDKRGQPLVATRGARLMRRKVIQIVEAITAAGGAYDSGVVDVEEFESVEIHVYVGSSGSLPLLMVTESGEQGFHGGTFVAGTDN
jgi:hypothetical protein